MDRHDEALAAFIAGELDDRDRRAWDRHLLECESCWRAVREDRLGRSAAARLRESAPLELADRIRFAVEDAGSGHTPARRHYRRWVLTGSGVLAALALVLVALVWPANHPRTDDPEIAAVVRLADAATTSQPHSPDRTQVVNGATLRLSYHRVADVEILRARSDRPFGMPGDAEVTKPGSMTWTITRGDITVYCPDSHTLVAAELPPTELPAFAAHLPG